MTGVPCGMRLCKRRTCALRRGVLMHDMRVDGEGGGVGRMLANNLAVSSIHKGRAPQKRPARHWRSC